MSETAVRNLRELDRVRKEQDAVVKKINKIHAKLRETPIETAERYGEKLWVKLRGFYVDAKKLADSEESLCSALLREWDGGAAGEPAGMKKTSASASHSTATAASLANICVGEQVAARVSPATAERDEWILVKVLRVDSEGGSFKFEVLDEDPGDEEEGKQRKYRLPGSCVIPLPKRTDWALAPDFPIGSKVLALYPGHTALYSATIMGPHRRKKSDDYILEFDGDEVDGVLPQRTVPFCHVVPLPSGYRQ